MDVPYKREVYLFRKFGICTLCVIVGMQGSLLANTDSIVHYGIFVQNKLPFSVNLRTIWADGTENNQKLNPCVLDNLRYPNAKYTQRFGSTRVHRQLLKSLEITNDLGYQNYLSGNSIENTISNVKGMAVELSLTLEQGEVYVAPRSLYCIRLLNSTDSSKTIILYYSNQSDKKISLDPYQFIFFGTEELGEFQRRKLSFWKRLRLAYHDIYVERLIVKDEDRVVHDLNRKEIKKVFSNFYRRPAFGLGSCMTLNEDGFAFEGRCSQLVEMCDSKKCWFDSD